MRENILQHISDQLAGETSQQSIRRGLTRRGKTVPKTELAKAGGTVASTVLTVPTQMHPVMRMQWTPIQERALNTVEPNPDGDLNSTE